MNGHLATSDCYLSLTQAARLCPSRPHPSALYRWARHGLQSRCGRRVRLKHVRCGRGLYTTVEWLHCFFEQLAKADLSYFEGHETDQEGAARAQAELDAAGL